MFRKAVVVHCFVPVVVAVAVKLITTVPPGRIANELPLVRLTLMKPAGAVLSTCHTTETLPGLVAVTEIEPGVPAPAGTATDTPFIASVPVGVLLVTVIEYPIGVPVTAVVGLMPAE